MPRYVTVGEAVKHTSYTHSHINLLARKGRIKAEKSGSLWLVDLDDVIEYERKMKELGSRKHDPTRSNL